MVQGWRWCADLSVIINPIKQIFLMLKIFLSQFCFFNRQFWCSWKINVRCDRMVGCYRIWNSCQIYYTVWTSIFRDRCKLISPWDIFMRFILDTRINFKKKDFFADLLFFHVISLIALNAAHLDFFSSMAWMMMTDKIYLFLSGH